MSYFFAACYDASGGVQPKVSDALLKIALPEPEATSKRDTKKNCGLAVILS
jgi:hypothetical protein